MAIVTGDEFSNDLFGTDLDDVLQGLGEFDLLFGSLGNDVMDGGADDDVAIYDVGLFTNGVFINNTSTAIGTVLAFTVDKRGFGTDTLIDVENFHGTNFDDEIHLGGLGGTYSFDRAGDDLVVASQDPNATDGHFFAAGPGNDTYFGTVQYDEVNYQGDGFNLVTQGATVDLAAGTATDGWGGNDTLVGIEGATGTEFDDTLIGDDNDNFLEGLGGNDTIEGRGGNDRIRPGAGNDIVDGGEGDRDTIDYRGEGGASGAVVDLAAGTATDTFGDTDTLTGIERVRGSDLGDDIRGDDQRNRLNGNDGDDYLEGRANSGDDGDSFRGGAGNDTIVGSDGQGDYAEYDDELAVDVFVDLAAGTATDEFGDTDTLISIEDIGTGDGNDTILGNAENNFLDGRGGNDTLRGFDGRDTFRGGAGDDILDGGDAPVEYNGGDRARYDREHLQGGFQGINADLNTGVVIDTFGDTDTLISIEEIEGSVFDDMIVGSGENERLRGDDGNDTIIGNDGNDDLTGGDGDDYLDGGVGGDFFSPGLGTDTVIGGANGPLFEDDALSYIFDSIDSGTTNGISVSFTGETDGTVVDYGGDTDTFTGIERIRGTNNADTFIGAEGRQVFRGFGGDDFFDGGAGDEDRIDYSRADTDLGASQGVTVDMVAGTATDAYGDTDTFQNIEEIRGSRFDDQITGNNEKNRLQGDDGDDVIDSFGGEDNSIDGGRGNDTIFARGDHDYVDGGDGNDLITFFGEGGGVNPGLGSDTITGGTEGFFSVHYDGVGLDLTIDTALGTTTYAGSPDVDTFTNIRNIGGGDGNDTLLGDDGAGRQEFFTSLGDDFIDGRGGGRDWLIYDDNNQNVTAEQVAVTVNFSTGTASGQLAGNDTFQNMEAVRGTFGDDVFIGGDQEFTEYQGLDGVDSYQGGTGQDRISFSFDDNRGGLAAIYADLELQEATDGWGNLETFSSIEQVLASDFDDTLLGSSGEDVLIGLSGADILDGRDGDDGLFAGGGADTITAGAGADRIGGRIWELDGDTITDFSAEDRIALFNDDFSAVLGADITIVGDELRIDTDGDGVAEATMFLTNGYSGPVQSEGGPVGGPIPAKISVENSGQFSAAVLEGSQTIEITLKREGDIFSTATVDVTVTGAGTNPADASDIVSAFGIPETVTFLPTETEKTIFVEISEDTEIEAHEDLAVTLANVTSDGLGGAELGGAETFIRILNEDFPETVNVTGEKAQEDSGVLTFTVARTGDTSTAITVNYIVDTAGGLQGAEADDLVDGLPQMGSVTIPVGVSEVTIDIAIAQDAVAELHDDVIATISDGGDWPAGLSVGVAQATGSIRNDDGVPPELPIGATGSNYGDPHIVTLDGLAYDFQAVGEFTLIEAASGDPLDIQVRFQPVAGSEVASQTTAVATMIGSARVVVDVSATSLVSIDGVAFDLAAATGGTPVGDGELYYDGEAITVVYANGEQLRIDVFGDFLSTSVSIGEGRDVRGLLGNADGDAANDLALPDGTVLAQPISFADLYGPYADAWRISDATSLFDYAIGQGTADFTNLSFPAAGISLSDFPVELLAQAEAIVAGIDDPELRDAALLDYLLTGDTAFVEAADTVEDDVDEAVAVEVTEAPSIASGIGVTVSDAEITEGDTGAKQVVFTVYRTGDLSEEVTIDYAVGGTADETDAFGDRAGTLTFAAGEQSKEVAFDVFGDTTVEANETLEFEFAVSGGLSPLLLSSSARVEIFNDDVAPPEPEFNVIIGTDGSDDLQGTDGADQFFSLGGRLDVMSGLGGADQFIFGAETRNGTRDLNIIEDFEVGLDEIVLSQGTEITAFRGAGRDSVAVIFEGDRDIVFVRGDGVNAEDLTIVYNDLLPA